MDTAILPATKFMLEAAIRATLKATCVMYMPISD
jgi:hypothetical protein